MGSQGRIFSAAVTTLPVAMSISRIRSHEFVVPVDQSFEMVDVQGTDLLRRSEVSMFTRTSLLFLRTSVSSDGRGGVLDAIYRGGVNGGIPAG